MSFFQGLLKGLRSNEQRRFDAWSPAPILQSIPAGHFNNLTSIDSLPTKELNDQKYPPAIVIGLGMGGEDVIHQWLDLMAEDPAGPQAKLRAIVLGLTPINTPFRTDCLPARYIEIRPEDRQNLPLADITGSKPSPLHSFDIFSRQRPNLIAFQEHLQRCIRDLHRDIRVIIVGKMTEPAIDLIGDVLQTLRLTKTPIGNPYLTITVLLTCTTTDAQQQEDQIYARLREISRLTFSGWHWMEKQIRSIGDGIIRSAVIDHLFLLDANYFNLDVSLKDLPFAQGMGLVMSETLFTLLHPASQLLWENLANDLNKGSQTRELTHTPIVNTLSIASLNIPQKDIQQYVAARLAYAILCGERSDKPFEGLVGNQLTFNHYVNDASACIKAWLTEGPCSHEIFLWLLNVADPSHFRVVPNPSPEFNPILGVQLAHGLSQLLNSSKLDTLARAQAALLWLQQRLLVWREWLDSEWQTHKNMNEKEPFAQLLIAWEQTTNELVTQIQGWIQVLGSPSVGHLPTQFGWQTISKDQFLPSWTGEMVAQTVVNVPQILKQKLETAESNFKQKEKSQVRQSLTAEKELTTNHVKGYYEDTVRPELSHPQLDNSLAFRQTRERIGWWIKISPVESPQIYLICVPFEPSKDEETTMPPEATRFKVSDGEKISQTLLKLTEKPVQGLLNDLSGKWLERRLDQNIHLLGLAGIPLLKYSDEIAENYSFSGEYRLYFMGRDRSLLGQYKNFAFPDADPTQINELDNGNSPHFTALGLWLNIPLPSIYIVNDLYQSYHHKQQLHIYPQEQNATLYEKRIHDLFGRWILLPPDLTIYLANLPMVTLFCQALFCGLIAVQINSRQSDRGWTILSLNDDFKELELVSADTPLALLWALKRFCLELPYDPELDQKPPDHHFSRSRRLPFINTLLRETQKHRRTIRFRDTSNQFKAAHLSLVEREGQRNRLAEAFAYLLKVELEEPVWSGWHDAVEDPSVIL